MANKNSQNMAKPTPQTPHELAVKQGKKNITLIISYLILAELFLLLLKTTTNQPIRVVDAIRLSITVGSSILMYQGNLWAKSFLAFVSGASALINAYTLYLVIQNPSSTVFAFTAILLLMILSGLSCYYLIFSTDIDEFLRSRKTGT